MRNPFGFFVELMQQRVWLVIWVLYLMVINVASLAFWHEPLARVVFIVFMFSAGLMMGLYSKFGFTKLLGLGHILWIPLLVYVLVGIPGVDGAYQGYLIVLAVSLMISLVFDVVDVWRYFTAQGAHALPASVGDDHDHC